MNIKKITILFLTAIIFLLSGCNKSADFIVDFSDNALDIAKITPYLISGSVSSYDRTGGNSDGFNESNFLRVEGDQKVLLDLSGGGYISRMWFTAFSNVADLTIIIDGELIQSDYLYKLFNNTEPQYPSPLAVSDVISSGGFVSYVPIFFNESIKITTNGDGDSFFYQIWYQLCPYEIEKPDISELNSGFNRESFSSVKNRQSIVAGGKEGGVIAELDGKYCITNIRLEFSGEVSLTEASLSFTWDNEPTFTAPLGAFFAVGDFGLYETNSLFTGYADGVFYCNFAMPFNESCKIELLNPTGAAYKATVFYQPLGDSFEQYGYFKTQYRQHDVTAGDGTPITVLSESGSGSMVGVVQSLTSRINQGLAYRWHLEGDEIVYIDGSDYPSIQGTGTEDFYNGGWYFSKGTFSTPLAGNTFFEITDKIDRTSMYRFFLWDKICFNESINFYIEHGAVNDVTEQMSTLAFYYIKPDNSQINLSNDIINLGDDESLKSHNYQGNGKITEVRSYYEGAFSDISALSCSFDSEEINFDAKIDRNADFIIIKRKFSSKEFNQQAEIFIDGVYIGKWYKSGGNGYKSLSEDCFIFKNNNFGETVSVTVKPIDCVWSAAQYDISSFSLPAD